MKKTIGHQYRQSAKMNRNRDLTIRGMKKFPENPESWNPIQLLNAMKPGIKYKETKVSCHPFIFYVSFNTGYNFFIGKGPSKKEAKKNCCIEAIKYLYKFDFYAIEDNSHTKK